MRWAWIGVGVVMSAGAGCGGKGGGAEVVAPPPDASAPATPEVAAAPVDPNQQKLDAASARLKAGQAGFDSGDFGKAMLEAQRGLDALGKDYAGPAVEDDTPLKIAAAKERAEAGSPSDGATIMLRMLRERIELARKHWQLGP